MTTIKGFTKAENSILFNSELSNNAKLIYLQIKYYSSIPNFKLSKSLIIKDSKLSVNTFDKVIRELRENNLIYQYQAKEGKKNIYWYSTEELKMNVDSNGNEPIEGQINLDEVTGASEKTEAIKESKQSRIDNHKNVRLVRSVINIDASNFDKEILSLADEELVRNTVKQFKKLSTKNKSFFTAKTIRFMLMQEYYNNKINMPKAMFNKLNSVHKADGNGVLKQYSDIKEDIEVNEALKEINEIYG